MFSKVFFSGTRIFIVNARKIHFLLCNPSYKNANHNLSQNGLNSSFRCTKCLLLFSSHCTRPIHIPSFWGQFSRNCHTYTFIYMICTMPVCWSWNQRSVRARSPQAFHYAELSEKTGFFWSQPRKAMGVLYQNRPKDMFIDETVHFVLILKLCFMCLKSISLHLSCFFLTWKFLETKVSSSCN